MTIKSLTVPDAVDGIAVTFTQVAATSHERVRWHASIAGEHRAVVIMPYGFDLPFEAWSLLEEPGKYKQRGRIGTSGRVRIVRGEEKQNWLLTQLARDIARAFQRGDAPTRAEIEAKVKTDSEKRAEAERQRDEQRAARIEEGRATVMGLLELRKRLGNQITAEDGALLERAAENLYGAYPLGTRAAVREASDV